MIKLVRLSVLFTALLVARTGFGQAKAAGDSTIWLGDTPGVIHAAQLPVIATPSATLVTDFKDLFEPNKIGNGSGPMLNPMAVSFVQDYISRYGKGLNKLKEWSRPYFNMMDAVFVEKGLPCELKYLAMIESRLNPSAVSWAGAVGPWQFMPATATRMGLKVTRQVDERTDYIRSTQAAAHYLTELYSQFGDWLLVIAAYNGGPGNVLKAMRRSGSRNFWSIQYYLPTESRNHVKKFISTHYIFEGQGGLTTLTRAETEEHYNGRNGGSLTRNLNSVEKTNAKAQIVTGKFRSAVIARNVVMELKEFDRYNPIFDKVMASASNTYELMLPADKMDIFNSVKHKILSESVELLLNPVTSFSQPPAAAPASVPGTSTRIAGK